MRHEQVQQVLGNQLTYLGGYKLGTPLHLLGKCLPDGRRPVGLLSLEDPEGSLGEVAGHSADGDGMALSLTDLIVDLAHVLGLPGGMVAVADDDIGGLDEGPL